MILDSLGVDLPRPSTGPDAGPLDAGSLPLSFHRQLLRDEGRGRWT